MRNVFALQTISSRIHGTYRMQEARLSEVMLLRLGSHVTLTKAERQGVIGLPSQARHIPGRNVSLSGRLAENHVHVIEDGLVCRYRDLADGRRQILSLLVPGDIVDLRQFVLGGPQPPMICLSPLVLHAMPNTALFALLDRHPNLTRALWSTTLVEESMAQEWLVSIGKRSAIERMAHLLCETFLRMRVVGRTQEDRFSLPLTQSDLADALGLSTVHVNRTLQELRKSGLIAFHAGAAQIFDFDALARLAMFSPAYLHLLETPEPG